MEQETHRSGIPMKWVYVATVLVAALIVGIAVDMSIGNLAKTRYQIVGDERAVWRLDARTGHLVYCERESSERDGFECRKVEDRALR